MKERQGDKGKVKSMSDKIRVSTDSMDQMVRMFRSLAGDLASASSKLDGMYMNNTTATHSVRAGSCQLSGSAGVSSISLGSTRGMVNRYGSVLNAYAERCRDLSRAVDRARELFSAKEAEIAGLVNGDVAEVGEALDYPKDTSTWTPQMWNEYRTFLETYTRQDGPDGGTVYVKDGHYIVIDANGKKEGEINLGDYGPFPGFETGPYSPLIMPLVNWANLIDADGYHVSMNSLKGKVNLGELDKSKFGMPKFKKGNTAYNTKTGEKMPVPKDYYKPDKTYFEFGGQNSAYIGWAMVDGSYSNDFMSAEGKAAFGYAEGKMGAYAGLYGYKADGTRVFAPGVRAEIGGSVSVLHADGKATFDLGIVDAEVKGSVDVGKIGANAKFQAGYVDGEFALHGGAGIEAVAVEAKTSGRVGVDGFGVGGEVGVQVGFSAKGEIGYNNGVLVIDGSLAVGVGVTGRIELDVSGITEFAADVVTNLDGAVDAVQDIGEAVWDGMSDFGDAVADGAKAVDRFMDSVFNW